jgi:glycosyltransferase involved in cell wall biosynthesis
MTSLTPHTIAPRPRAVIDGAVLGTALVYEKHRTGVHRVLKELLEELKTRPDVHFEFLSSGRAVWLEFPTHIAFQRHWIHSGWVFRARKARVPGTYGLLMKLARGLLDACEKKMLSEKIVVAGLQVLSLGLRARLAAFTATVYYSPAHALPRLPEGVSRCLTLYDMIPAKFPQWYDEARSFHTIINSIDPHSDTIIAISECTRRDWLDHSHGDPARARVITLGVSDSFKPYSPDSNEVNRVRQKYGATHAPFLLAVGTLEPRKNLETLIRAFFRLREGGRHATLKLLLVGPRGWKNDSLFKLLEEHPEVTKDIHLTGFVPDEDLPGLYAACEGFVYPSRYEGFGLPVAEALKCGSVVVCGDNSSLREVAGGAAIYADVNEIDAVAEAIDSALSDSSRREKLKRAALERAPLFDWKAVADAYLETFTSVEAESAVRDARARASINP